MILKDTTPMHVHNPKKIKRTHSGVVVSEPETKDYKIVFKKRRLRTTLTPQPRGMINLLVGLTCNLFIYSSREKCNK